MFTLASSLLACEKIGGLHQPTNTFTCGSVTLPNFCPQPLGWSSGKYLKEGRHGFANATRVLNFDTAGNQAQCCKTHGHSMVVISFDFGVSKCSCVAWRDLKR